MNKKSVLIPEGSFGSPLIRICAVLFAAAAVAGLLSIFSLFIPDAIHYLDADSEYQSYKFTWTIIHTAFIIFGTLCTAGMSLGLFGVVTNKVDKGLTLITRGSNILRVILNAIGISLVVLFVYKLIPYVSEMLKIDGGIIPLFSGLLAEFFLAAIDCMIFLLLREFLGSVCDAAASISLSHITGILRYPTISMRSATGFLVLGLVSVYLACNRFSSIGIWMQDQISTVTLLALYFSAAMFLVGGAAGILMFVYLRKFKLDCEYLLHKGTPVEEEKEENKEETI